MNVWDPDFIIDQELAVELIGEQCAELSVSDVQLLGQGWDNTVFLVNDQYAFRFPRRKIAVDGLAFEIEALPRLSQLLTLPTPVPEFIGRPSSKYPCPFYGARLLSGRELLDTTLDPIAGDLAGFLRQLHNPQTLEAMGKLSLKQDPNQRADMRKRVPSTRKELAEFELIVEFPLPDSLDDLLTEAENLPPTNPSVVTHGDLHIRHLLLDRNDRISAVIDWGDLGYSDPAIDFSLLWSSMSEQGRSDFIEVYGPVDEAQLLRARVLAIFLSIVHTLYGHRENFPDLKQAGLIGLRRALNGL